MFEVLLVFVVVAEIVMGLIMLLLIQRQQIKSLTPNPDCKHERWQCLDCGRTF